MKVGIPLRRWDSISQNFTNIDKNKIDNWVCLTVDTAIIIY